MKSIACLLAALSVIGNMQPWALGADTAKGAAIQPPTIRLPTINRVNASPGFTPAPQLAIPRPGYLAQPPSPALRFGATRPAPLHGGSSKFAESEHRSAPVTQSEPPSNSSIDPQARTKARGSTKRPDASSHSLEVNLQRLVRYFEKDGAASTNTHGSVSFSPPVNEADLSKTLTPSGGIKQ